MPLKLDDLELKYCGMQRVYYENEATPLDIVVHLCVLNYSKTDSKLCTSHETDDHS